MNDYKIMIVDDEPDILKLLEKSLTIEGFHHIIKVDNGLSAVSSCKELRTFCCKLLQRITDFLL